MPYIHFTNQQKEQAAGVDLAAFLESRGEKLIRSGRDFRLTSDHSVTIQGNRWYDHAAQRGGGPISFVRQFLDWGITFEEPYIVPKRKDCAVKYASRVELRKSVLEKYPPPEIEEPSARSAKSRKRGSGTGGLAVGLQQSMGGVRV